MGVIVDDLKIAKLAYCIAIQLLQIASFCKKRRILEKNCDPCLYLMIDVGLLVLVNHKNSYKHCSL